MTRVRLIRPSVRVVIAGATLSALGSTALRGAPQLASAVSSPAPGRSGPAKPPWHGRPASTPPETELVPPPPEAPPPAKSLILGAQKRGNKAASVGHGAVPATIAAASGKASSRASSEPASEMSVGAGAADPEILRIRDELKRLHDDNEARRTFYEDLRRTVEQVRTGARDEDSSQPQAVPLHSRSSPAEREPAQPPDNPGADEPRQPPPVNPDGSRVSLGSGSGSLDRSTYLLVVRWAKANNTPVPLALGVAWIESRLHANPPRGATGEIGMFQIIPARCKLEGWPPKRLAEPEFNAWMGTRLLARYYQEEGSWARAAAKYVAGPGVFNKRYSIDVWNYINWYASSVDSYADYFSRYQS